MKFHIRSAAIGAVLALATASLLSAQVATVAHAVLRVVVANTLDVNGIPSPDQLVRIESGVPFDIPAGRVFVLTMVGSQPTGVFSGSGFSSKYVITVDGVEVAKGVVSADSNGANGSQIYFWGQRLDGGQILLTNPSPGSANPFLLGYLADA